MTNAHNTVANQYLNSILRVGAKPLMIISILLTAMFILAACGGGAAAPAATPTADPCRGNPFGSTCNSPADQARRATVVQTCLAAAAANTPACAQAIDAEPCIVNPSGKDTDGTDCSAATEFIAYLPTGTTIETVRNTRETYCEDNPTTAAICGGVLASCNAANPFANDLCDTATGIAGLRTTYCTTAATLWEDACDAGEATYGNATALRNTACETYGTNTDGTNNGDTSCANRANIMTACTAATPFANEGCDTAADTIIDDDDRVAFCIDTTVGDGANPFNAKCADSVALETAKNTACETYGTTADATCNLRQNIMTTCTAANPFANTGCDTADDTIITDNDRMTYCTTDATSFHVNCSEATYTGTNAARASLVDACSASDTTGVTGCDTPIDGMSGITVTACIGNPFSDTDGCGASAAFGAVRTSICTTDATSFNPNCVDGTHGEVDKTREALANKCLTMPELNECTMTFVNGVDGINIADCSADPFLGTNGCGANIAFNGIRTGICTTEATLFNRGCTNANYDTSAGLRTELIAKCAVESPPSECTTIYVDGGDTGATVAMCAADPFLPACGASIVVDDTFATARMERNTLCAPTGSPFDTTCNISTFGTDNDANRDTYCLTIAIENNADCAGSGGRDSTDRLAEICGDTETHNPFALLCGASNTANRATFCGLGTMQNDNLDCSEDTAVQCNRNPFGTTLGKSADINCTADYADARLALADACREGTTPVGGATCTVAVNRCIANPFSDSVFNGGACDRVAFEGAHAPYCAADANPWQTNCDTVAMENGKVNAVDTARTKVCLDNGAIMTDSVTLAAGDSLFNTLCGDVVIASGQTIAEARLAWCTVGDNIFDTDCGDADAHGGTNAARDTACATTAETPLTSVGTAECAGTRADTICGTDGTEGSNPFAAICSVATQNVNNSANYLDAQQYYCSLTANNAQQPCEATIAGVCGATDAPVTTTTAIFDRLCLADEYLAAQRTYCSVTALDGDADCNKMQGEASASIKETICNGDDVTDSPYADVCGTSNVAAQEAFCGLNTHAEDPTACVGTRMVACDAETGNPFIATLCFETGNTFGAARIKRADDCRGDGNNDADEAVQCDAAVMACNSAPFGTIQAPCDAAVYVNALIAYCTVGDNIFNAQCVDGTHGAVDAVNDARQAACNTIADVPVTSVGTAECAGARALAICGTDTVAGSNPFAAICSVLTQNANMPTHNTAIAFYCAPEQGNLSNALCENVTSGDWVLGNATANGGAALTTTPTGDAGDLMRNNEFLAIEGNTISTTGTATATSGAVDPTVATLDFTAITYNTETLTNLSATNGLAFFTGYHGDDTEESAYAGIYETADLGGPLVDSVTGATWSGELRILDAGTVVEADFNLNVTFASGDGGGAGFISAFIANVSGDKDFNINGTFDASGVLLTASNVYYGEMGDSSPAPASNGRLSGIIGQDGAIGVFVSNDTEALYTGGFVATGVCSVNIFDAGCLLDDEHGAETAFCTNATDNTGKNPFNAGCNTDGTTHGDVNAARVIACRAFGDAADDSCKNSDEVRGVCDGDPFAQTTGLASNTNLCTGENDMNVAYADARTECETAGVGSFATKCDAQDQIGKVKEARDTYCRDTAQATDTANCGAGAGQVDRIAQFCATGTGTSIFSDVCSATGTVTIAQSTACGGAINDLTARGAVETDCKMNDLSSTICGTGSNPGSDPFAPICGTEGAPDGFNRVAAQLALCKGELTGFAGNAVVTDCKAGGQSVTICGTGAVPGEDPFAPICGRAGSPPDGFMQVAAQLAICSGPLGELTDGGAVATDCQATSLSGAICGQNSNPGSDPFAPICSTAGVLTGFDIAAAQLAICSGPLGELTDGAAVASDCNDALLSGAICGDASSNPGTDPFAPICSESAAIISGFDIAMAQNNYCRSDSRTSADADIGDDCQPRSVTICAANDDPFATICGTNDSAQNDHCRSDSRTSADADIGDDCQPRSVTICAANDDPFATICGTNDSAQNDHCRSDSRTSADADIGDDCQPRSVTICAANDDPFATICGTNDSAQNDHCRSDSRTSADADIGDDCQPRSVTICAANDDPFATICGTNDSAQNDHCRSDSRTSADADIGDDCQPRSVTICAANDDPFATICGTNDSAQNDHCRSDSRTSADADIGDDCQPRSVTICAANDDPFATICGTNDSAQNDHCRSDSRTSADADIGDDCQPRSVTICAANDDPFATICGTNDSAQNDHCRSDSRTSADADIGDDCQPRSVTICAANDDPFATICGTNDSAQNDHCRSDSRTSADADIGDDCQPRSVTICAANDDPFATICGTNDSAQNDHCRSDSRTSADADIGDDCQPRSVTICAANDDPFATICGTNDSAQNDHCRSDSRTSADADIGDDCQPRSVTICAANDDPFATICGTNDSAQNDHCRSDSRTSADADIGDDCQPRSVTICAANDDPFATICGTNESAQDTYCRSDSRLPADAGAGMDCNGRRAGICGTNGTKIFATLCGANDEVQIAFCKATPTANDPLCSGRKAAICTTSGGTSPFSTLCGSNNVANQRIFCTDNSNFVHSGATGDCANTISNFCTDDNNDIFNALCTVAAKTYDVRRGARCAAIAPDGARNGGCGDETAGYIKAYCDGSSAAQNNARDCGNTAYKTENPTLLSALSASSLTGLGTTKNNALNSDGTALLGAFVATGSPSTAHAIASFMQDGTDVADRLELGGSVVNPDEADNHGFLKLTDVSGVDVTNTPNGATSGFAFARAEFGGNNNDKLYVGLLDGTNLGAPITSNATDGSWKTRYSILTGIEGATAKLSPTGGTEESASLTVNFGDNTIKSNELAPSFTTLGKIGIDGKFTANGVIYGTVGFDNTNTGTLTGLIGQQGAVGIFKSEDNPNANPYVGGFVSSPNNTAPPAVNCDDEINAYEQAPDPFNNSCTDNDDEQTRACINGTVAANMDFTANCVDNQRVTNLVCNDSGLRANPFNATICTNSFGGLTEKKNPLLAFATPIVHF